MVLTKDFKTTIVERAQRDHEFRRAMLVDAINELLSGDVDAAKQMLRDYINATISFGPLAKELHKNSKSLQRMLSQSGNPSTKSLFEMIHVLQIKEGIKLRVHLNDRSKRHRE